MTAPEKIGIAVVVLFVALLGYFLADFFLSDSSQEGPELDPYRPQAAAEEDRPAVDGRIDGAAEAPPVPSVRETILPDREALQGSARLSVIAGRTVDEAGKPVQGTRITLRKGGNLLMPHIPGQELTGIEEKSDPEGRFELTGVEGGADYSIVAEHPSYAEATFSPLRVRSGTRVEVPDIVLGAGTLVKGKVTDSYGRPIAGALVQIQDPVQLAFQEASQRKPWKQMLTDDAGGYRFGNVSFKTFEVTASAEGFATQRVSGNVQFEAVKEKTIDFSLSPGSSIAGFVLQETGAPVEGASVEATLIRNKEFASSGTVLSGAGGAFRVQGLAEGYYVVRVSMEGFSDEVMQSVQTGTADLEVLMKRRGGVGGNTASVRQQAICTLGPYSGVISRLCHPI